MPPPFLKAARELRGLINENAEKFPDEPVRPESVQALRSAGLFGVMTPEAVGGAELPLSDVLDVFAEVARADGSTGWCLMAGASGVAYFGAYCEDAFVESFFADGVPLVAGQFSSSSRDLRSLSLSRPWARASKASRRLMRCWSRSPACDHRSS